MSKGPCARKRTKRKRKPKSYRRLSEEEWTLVRYAVLRERATIKAAAATFDVSERTISKRRKLERWGEIDPLKSYIGLPKDEEILEMRSRYIVDKAIKAIHDKLVQASRSKNVAAKDVAVLASAASALEGKLRRRAPARTAASVDGVRAGRQAPSVDDAIAILDSRAARRRKSGESEDPDRK